MNKPVVIHNPSAGRAASLNEAVERLARRHGCHLFRPNERESIADAVERAAQAGAPRLIVAGGDGTIARVVNSLLPKFPELPLAVVPLGTGNDLARSLDLPIDDVELAFDLAATHRTAAIDVVRVHKKRSSSYFVNAATGGFGGELNAVVSAQDKQQWGPFAYWIATATRFVEMRVFDLTMLFDDQEIRLPVFGIGLANGRYVGGGFPIAHAAMLNDGLLDITLVPEVPTVELLVAGLSFLLSGRDDAGPVVSKRARRVQIQSQPDMPFSLDGEPTQAVDAVFEVIPGGLLVVPGDQSPCIG